MKLSLVLLLVTPLLLSLTTMAQFVTPVMFNGTDGGNPVYGPLVQGLDGSYYGTTQFGGNYQCGIVDGCGTIFKVTRSGQLTMLYEFCEQSDCPDGANPWGGLLLATDGNFYGTTYLRGQNCPVSAGNACGTVFRMTPQGKLTTLYTFCQLSGCLDGASPTAALIQGTDGNFFGTTTAGGPSGCPSGCGTVFRITPNGILTTLYAFSSGFDGNYPVAPLVQGLDGNFYGTTSQGGYSCEFGDLGCGIVFQLTPSGVETPLYYFCKQYFSCTDGGQPFGGLLLASDGNFYGTTGYEGAGTIFRITPTGSLTTLYNFCRQTNCADGGSPTGTLIQGTDGALYGTTQVGGGTGCQSEGCGVVFRLSTSGFQVLHTFQGSDGENPASGLTQSTEGYFVGSTYQGGGTGKCFFVGCGTLFGMSTGLGPFVTFVNSSAPVGQRAGVLGQGFTRATSVVLNGVSANFQIISDTALIFTVPQGSTTGYVTVTTPNGSLTSNVVFRVLQ